jgi:hypothetical protein
MLYKRARTRVHTHTHTHTHKHFIHRSQKMSGQYPGRPRSSSGNHVIEEADLIAYDAMPVCVSLVDYEGSVPKNLWANLAYLNTVGCTLEEFIAQVPCASKGESSLWEHMYHEVQLRGNEICERTMMQHYRSPHKTSAETMYKACLVRLKGHLLSCIMLSCIMHAVSEPNSYLQKKIRVSRWHHRRQEYIKNQSTTCVSY